MQIIMKMPSSGKCLRSIAKARLCSGPRDRAVGETRPSPHPVEGEWGRVREAIGPREMLSPKEVPTGPPETIYTDGDAEASTEAGTCPRPPGKASGLGKLRAPAPIILPRPGRLLRLAGTQEFLICHCLPRPSRALNHVRQGGREATVVGGGGGGRGRPRGTRCAPIPRQASTFLLGCHCATHTAPPGSPLHTVPIVCPRHFEAAAAPGLRHRPTPSYRQVGLHEPERPVPVPSPKAPPCQLPWSRAVIREGRRPAPSHTGQTPNPWTPPPP